MQQSVGQALEEKFSYSRLLSGSFMVAGTAVGAGILGIPLATASAGFIPASLVMIGTWIFMMLTGFLFLEVSLWMPDGSNILSMTDRFLGNKGKAFSGAMFMFLYYCLIIAYMTAGAPLFSAFFAGFGYQMPATSSLFLFTAVFGSIVLLGAKTIDRANILLSLGMITAYILMICIGMPAVTTEHLDKADYSKLLLGVPVLFGAFGYHNVIPSLTTYLKRDKKVLRLSIFFGTMAACLMYLLWEFLVLGSVSKEALQASMLKGLTGADALQEVTGHPNLFLISRFFAFFAVTTSLLGVSFSFIDFLADGFNLIKMKCSRFLLALLTFGPPLIISCLDPMIFNTALGLAGGIGESFLNGILPVLIVWAGTYTCKMSNAYASEGKKLLLISLFCIGVFVMGLELFEIIR